MNSYREEQKSKSYIKQLQQDMAIGLQEVDNLKPSEYLKNIKEKCFKRINNRRSSERSKRILCRKSKTK